MGAFEKFLNGAAEYVAARVEVDRLLELSPAVARRDVKTQNWEDAQLRRMIGVLDEIARAGRDDGSERAAELAEYIETLL